MIVPNFLIVGGQKCGTSWLHSMLAQHPQTFMSKRKELFYFSKSNKFNDFHTYLKNFDVPRYKKIVGESSTSYLWTYDPESPFKGGLKNKNITSTISEYLGEDVKIVISVRHPIGRAISAFYHHYRMDRVNDQSCLSDYIHNYGIIEYGFFSRHIENWEKELGQEQIYVAWFEDIRSQPLDMLLAINKYLDLKDFEYENSKSKKNAGFGLVLTKEGHIKPNKPEDKKFDKFPVVTQKDLDLLMDIYKDEIANMQKKYPNRCADWHNVTIENVVKL